MNKDTLRKEYLKLRSQLLPIEIENKSLEIANNLLKLPIWNKKVYHIFLPIKSKNEVNTEFILPVLKGKDKQIVISKTNFETLEMTHFLLEENTKLIKNKYGIPEPENAKEIELEKIEVVFVPLLAFDKAGNRIGYGKGFYDRFLEKCNPHCLKIGLSFFEPEIYIKTDLYDISLNYCVNHLKVYSF